MKRSDINKKDVSPMMRQYLEIKEKYEDAILFFRLGDFYEMFFEDAELAARELELVLTGRNASLKERVPMCGVPYHAANSYISKLVDKGYKVAICEQLEEAQKGTMVKRDVVELITPGTYLDDNNVFDNNFVAVLLEAASISLSFTDITTGDFFSKSFDKAYEAVDFIIKEDIKEVVLPKIEAETYKRLKNSNIFISEYKKKTDKYETIYQDLNLFEKEAARTLISYLEETKKKDLSHLKTAINLNKSKNLLISDKTAKHLELVKSSGTKKNSLLGYLDYTSTAMGYRLLKHSILNPLTDKNDINYRYDLIDSITKDYVNETKLGDLLKSVYDLEKISSKIVMNNLTVKDLLSLKNSIQYLGDINKIIKLFGFKENLINLDELFKYLDSSIQEEASFKFGDGKIFKKGFNNNLDEIIAIKKSSKNYLLELEASEKKRTGINNLKIGFNKVFGYYIEISKSSLKDVKAEFGYIRKQTLTSAERFITEDLKEKEDIILNAEYKIEELERKLFDELRLVALKYLNDIQHNAEVISFIDMMHSLSKCALDNKLVRPVINEDNNFELIDSKHPVVEKNTSQFVPNNLLMNSKTTMLLITGPNMSGKSTYMRQVAIAVIMAQLGSFVPASKMTYQIFDKVFTRIGASDDLNAGESTFMMEMKEAQIALAAASSKSLIIFDELGRGTSTYDGMALARAILEYIHEHIKCKTLFSTHYHELTDLSSSLMGLVNVHVAAEEEGGTVHFLYKVKKGKAEKSYGIHVAKIAGINNEILSNAAKYLHDLENKHPENTSQISFDFSKEEGSNDDIINKIKEFDLMNHTGLDALNFIAKIKDDINKK